MKQLLESLNDKHPFSAGILGAASGFAGWFFSHLPDINALLTFIGSLTGTITVVLTLSLKLRSLWAHRHDPRPLPPDDDLPWEWPNHLPK